MNLRGIKHIPLDRAPGQAFDAVTLEADERNLRRKLIVTDGGLEVLVDLGLPTYFEDGDHLELQDGRYVEILAAEEELYEITGVSPAHLVQLAWHIGNRHLPAQLDYDRIFIKRDPVIRDMLIKRHAVVNDVRAPFDPAQGAYHGH